MKLKLFFFRAFIAIALLGPQVVLAQGADGTKGSTDGKLGELLSAELYCGVKGLVEGNVGLAIGLLIMFSALWSLVKGGKLAPAMISIVFGALITAIPSLIESTFSGIAELMRSSGMSKPETTFNPPLCGGIREQINKTMQEVERNRKLDGVCTGGYLDCS